jgi:very-short-patch-repair endonuclease
VAFRGSAAVAADLTTWTVLHGPGFLRVFPDTYVTAPEGGALDLRLRSLAAYRYVEGNGVLSGYSAAEMLGASCGPRDAPAEVTVPHRGQRRPAGLVVRRAHLHPGEITQVKGLKVTSPVRTAYDLARRGDLVERVVAVDRLANVHCFSPELLLHFSARYSGSRGNRLVPHVLAHADRRACSPMETRLRMLIVQAGLPRPEVQWVVQDEHTRTAVWLDLAWPDLMIGIEYEGMDHTEPDRVLRDVGRYTGLVDKGWHIYRYTKFEILRRRELIVAQLSRARARFP